MAKPGPIPPYSRVSIFQTRTDEIEFHFLWNAIKSTPPILFHYTGNSGLRGIVQSTSVWATDARFLNDSQEVQMALDTARKVVQVAAKKSSAPFADLLCKEFLLQLHLAPQSLYVFSLTSKGDSLTHWRGYCKDSAGYAIGFKSEELEDWCKSNGLVLSNVIYGTKVYSRDLERLFSAYVDDLSSYFPYFAKGEINADLLEALAIRFAKRVLKYAPFIKHEGFSEEEEWRIVQFVPANKGKVEVFFRDTAYSLVPHIALNFPPATFFAALGVINVKPSEHAAVCSEGLRNFVRAEAKKKGLGETKSLLTEVSAIPFRPGF